MSDIPPRVDFNRSYDPLQDLLFERRRVQNIATDIRSAMADVRRFNAEGAQYATIAGAWAATLMLADICKIGLSAADRRANILFKAQDKALANANKVLKLLGLRTLATKEDVLKSLDPELRNAAQWVQSVQKARNFLKARGLKENKEMKLLLDLSTAMADDTLLLMQSMATQQQIQSNAAHAQNKMRENLLRVNRRLLLIDGEILHMIQRAQFISRIA